LEGEVVEASLGEAPDWAVAAPLSSAAAVILIILEVEAVKKQRS